MLNKSSRAAAILALPLAAGIAHAGSPLLRLNEDGSTAIFFVADASASYNDNIFYQPTKTDDVIFRIAPGFEFVAGGDGNSKFNLIFKEAFSAYVDHDGLNSQLANVDAKYTYDAQSALKATVTAGFHQLAQPDNQLNIVPDIVQRNSFNAGASAEYKATEKSTFSLGGNYNGLRYTTYDQFFNDTDSFSAPASWYYAVTDKLDAGLTYQYTYTQIHASAANPTNGNQQIHFAGLTSRGNVTEKLKLEANAGVGFASLDNKATGTTQDDTTFNFNLTSTYAVTEKLTASLSGGRNFSVGALGQQITTTNGTFGLNYVIDESWSANTSVGYMIQDFGSASGREDNIITAGLGVNYALNKYWNFGANYSFLNDDTNIAGGDFNNSIISLSATVRY